MPAPLMFTGIGELIVILLIVAFVVACFCLMLVGLGALIAIPLLLIMPFFYKNAKDRKESLLVCLCLIPIGVLGGTIGIELFKIFGEWAIGVFKISFIFRFISLFIAAFVMGTIVSLVITYRLRKLIDDLDMKALMAKRNYEFTLMDEYQAKCAPLKKRAELIYTLCGGGTCLIIVLIAIFMGWI